MQVQKADEALRGFELNILQDTNLLYADIALGTFTDILKIASAEQQGLLIQRLYDQVEKQGLLKKIMAHIRSQSFVLKLASDKKILDYAQANAKTLEIPPRLIACLKAFLEKDIQALAYALNVNETSVIKLGKKV